MLETLLALGAVFVVALGIAFAPEILGWVCTPRDWYPTDEHRWVDVKQQGGYVVQRYECRFIDMNSGALEWKPARHMPFELAPTTRFVRRPPDSDPS